VREEVLWLVVIGVDGGGGLQWPEPMVVEAFVHVGGPPPMSISG
jgi:hypothetical protein